MTRINCGIPPAELNDKHLIAEHREIKRIPNAILNGRCRLDLKIPETFRLGTGHVRFFYDKLKYLHKRYNELHQECIQRGFKVTNFEEAFLSFTSSGLYNDYSPSPADRELVIERIQNNIKSSIDKKMVKKLVKSKN
jgi:hypothetical protein